MAGTRVPIPGNAMYCTFIHTPYWGGGENVIAAGSLVKCLRAKAEFDYQIRSDAFSYSWVQRWDGKVVDAPRGAICRLAWACEEVSHGLPR